MKKKVVFAVVIMLLCAIMCLALVGCNENYKQKAVSTDKAGIETVTSNGGMAVKAGKYLYFINGYAGQDGANDFGKAVKGAIMRVELSAAGTPITDTLVTIVPKNVYNSNADCGLVIMGDFIYYSTPSIDQDGSGKAKTSKMVLMRTRLDGTDTKVIAKFDDFNAVYRVTKNYITYIRENELHVIDLNSKKFKDTKIDEEISAYNFADYADNANELQDVVFYTKSAENAYATNNVLWAYRAGGEKKVVIDGLTSYDAQSLAHPGGYKITILDTYFVGNGGIRLAYTKSDSGSNTKSTGVYMYDFNSDLTFKAANEVRYTEGTTYTSLTYIDANNILAVDSSKVYYLRKVTGEWKRDSVIEGSSVNILDIEINNGLVTAYYVVSSKLYKIDILSSDGAGAYNLVRKSAISVYEGSYNTSWITLDKVGRCVYMFNSNVADNIYYLDLAKVETRNANTMIASQLGKFSAKDNLAMLDSAA